MDEKFDATRYTISIRKEYTEDGWEYVARIAEFPDVVIYEETPSVAYDSAIDVLETVAASLDEMGTQVPPPEEPRHREFSGRLPLRVPRSLHARLHRQAEANNVSQNHWCVYLLAQNSAVEEVRSSIDAIADGVRRVFSFRSAGNARLFYAGNFDAPVSVSLPSVNESTATLPVIFGMTDD